VKFENTIDRVRGTAQDPRPLERVPAGVEFDFNMSLKLFDGDDKEQLIGLVKKGLKLIELDALGGNSSRGCGQVRFHPLHIDGKKETLADVQLD
jgi:CRISPR-associated protein Csm3